MKTLIKNIFIVLVFSLSFNAKAQFKFSNLEKVVLEKNTDLSKDNIEKYNKIVDSIIILKKEKRSDNITKVREAKIELEIEQKREKIPKKYIIIDEEIISFPSSKKSQALFNALYDNNSSSNIKTLNTTGFIIGNTNKSVYSELINGYIGIARVSFGSMLMASSDAKEEDTTKGGTEEVEPNSAAIQHLVAGGSNLVLKLEYPVFFHHINNHQFNFITLLQARGGADFPTVGTETDKWAGSLSYGIKSHASVSLDNKEMSFFADFEWKKTHATGVFQTNLNLDKRNFYFSNFKMGLVIQEKIQLSLSIASFSDEPTLKDNPLQIGIIILK